MKRWPLRLLSLFVLAPGVSPAVETLQERQAATALVVIWDEMATSSFNVASLQRIRGEFTGLPVVHLLHPDLVAAPSKRSVFVQRFTSVVQKGDSIGLYFEDKQNSLDHSQYGDPSEEVKSQLRKNMTDAMLQTRLVLEQELGLRPIDVIQMASWHHTEVTLAAVQDAGFRYDLTDVDPRDLLPDMIRQPQYEALTAKTGNEVRPRVPDLDGVPARLGSVGWLADFGDYQSSRAKLDQDFSRHWTGQAYYPVVVVMGTLVHRRHAVSQALKAVTAAARSQGVTLISAPVPAAEWPIPLEMKQPATPKQVPSQEPQTPDTTPVQLSDSTG